MRVKPAEMLPGSTRRDCDRCGQPVTSAQSLIFMVVGATFVEHGIWHADCSIVHVMAA